VLALAAALALSPAERDRLLTAADMPPEWLVRLDAADPTLVLVADILADDHIPADQRDDFRRQIALAARRWRPDVPLP
jgi:hypothetical protein